MTTYLSEPCSASACAENSATAAKAAVQQLAVEPFLKEFPEPSIVRHPSASLHVDVVSAIIPAIEVFAAHKNVAVAEHEYEMLAWHALEHVSGKTMRLLLAGDASAMKLIHVAINHTLDVLGAANLMRALIAAEGRELPDAATLLRMGEASMKAQFANDKAPAIRIWPDVGAVAAEHRKRISKQADQPPMLTLPNGVFVQCDIRKPSKGWASIIHAATPGREGAIHE